MNKENANLILDFHEFIKENGISERYQNNNLKTIISFTNYIESKFLTVIDNKEDVFIFEYLGYLLNNNNINKK